MSELILHITGYLGSVLLLLAFIMVTRGYWDPKSLSYLLVNIIGSISISIYQIWLGAYAPIILNMAFIIVGVWGLVSYKPWLKQKR